MGQTPPPRRLHGLLGRRGKSRTELLSIPVRGTDGEKAPNHFGSVAR